MGHTNGISGLFGESLGHLSGVQNIPDHFNEGQGYLSDIEAIPLSGLALDMLEFLKSHFCDFLIHFNDILSHYSILSR